MKKFKLGAGELLGRTELQHVLGGNLQECRLTYTFTHNNETHTDSGFHYPAGEAGSAAANQECVDNLTLNIVTECSYDCEYDGWGV